MIKKSVLLIALFAIALFSSPELLAKDYENPVIGKDWPDPTAWQADDGTFYTIATMGRGLRTLLKSQNLVDWEDTGIAPFSRETLEEMHKYGRMLWAPDMAKIGNKWMLYYTLYNADVDSSIGVLSSESPTGPWTFEGVVTRSVDTGIKDTIDPNL
jgi:arabinan endo-1,5-alpha-L-arabinosidase